MPSVGGVGARTGSIGTQTGGLRSTGNYNGGLGSTVGGQTAKSNTQTGGNAQSGKMGASSTQSGAVRSSATPSSPSRSSVGGNAQSGYSGPKGTPTGGLNTAAKAASSVAGRAKTGGSGNALAQGISSGKMQSTQSPMNRLGGSTGRITSPNALSAGIAGRSPDPGVLGVAGGVSGRMSPAYASRFNFTGGAKARQPTNPFGGTSTPAVGQMIGFADHLRAQGIMDPLNVMSAFRSQKTQDALRKANPASAAAGRIAKHSAHTTGQAIDITHPAMSNSQLAAQVASYPGFNKMMGYGHKNSPSQGSHVHTEAGEGPMKALGYIGGQRTADIARSAPRPTQTASLGPTPTLSRDAPAPSGTLQPASPHLTSPPIPQRNPMRTNIPIPQRASVAGRIAAQGIPIPQMAPGGFFPNEIDAAMKAQNAPSAPAERNPMTSSTPATMVDYTRVIDALERDIARQRQANAPQSAPQMHPDRSQELASRRLPSQPLLNTRSATAVEGRPPSPPLGPSAPNADMIARAYSEDARVNERRYDAPRLAFRALNGAPDPRNLSGGPPNRSPYYSQGDMSDAEMYAGPGIPDPPGLQDMPPMEGLPSEDAFTFSTQEQNVPPPATQWAPSMEAIRAMSERWQTAPPVPPAHEIQQPGQVPGRPSVIADVGQQTPMQHGIEQGIETGVDKWREAEQYIKTANSGRRDMFGNGNERINELARQIVSADPSQAENAENPLWWFWLDQMMQQQGAVA